MEPAQFQPFCDCFRTSFVRAKVQPFFYCMADGFVGVKAHGGGWDSARCVGGYADLNTWESSKTTSCLEDVLVQY